MKIVSLFIYKLVMVDFLFILQRIIDKIKKSRVLPKILKPKEKAGTFETTSGSPKGMGREKLIRNTIAVRVTNTGSAEFMKKLFSL